MPCMGNSQLLRFVVHSNSTALLELRAWEPSGRTAFHSSGVVENELLLTAAQRLRLLECDASRTSRTMA